MPATLLIEIEGQIRFVFSKAELERREDRVTSNTLFLIRHGTQRRIVAVTESFLGIKDARELARARRMLSTLPIRLGNWTPEAR